MTCGRGGVGKVVSYPLFSKDTLIYSHSKEEHLEALS